MMGDKRYSSFSLEPYKQWMKWHSLIGNILSVFRSYALLSKTLSTDSYPLQGFSEKPPK